MILPKFPYHPDPIATGSIKQSDSICKCCKKSRGYIYVGPVYAEEDLDNYLCPWCIADGSAYKKFQTEFTDPSAIGNYGKWGKVSVLIQEEVAFRTPSFYSWQEARWWIHCDDAAEFIGTAGKKEVLELGDEFVDYLRTIDRFEDNDEWQMYLNALDKKNSPTAYIFRCRVCGKFGGYSDCH